MKKKGRSCVLILILILCGNLTLDVIVFEMTLIFIGR